MANYIDEAHPDLTEESLNQFLNSSSVPLTDKVPLESLSTLFKTPENPQFIYSTFGESFERYKVKADLFKWLIGTVGLSLITLIINWGFRDREQGMNEISQYDKYATELIVLNDNPVKKRMLAQFFAKVTPSSNLKKGWQVYYDDVNKEYHAFMKNDSLKNKKLEELNKIESSKLTNRQKEEKQKLENETNKNNQIKNAPIIIPNQYNAQLDGMTTMNRNTRISTTEELIKEESSNPEVIREVLSSLKEPKSPDGLWNNIVYLNATKKFAYDNDLVKFAMDEIASFESDVKQGKLVLGPTTKKSLENYKNYLQDIKRQL